MTEFSTCAIALMQSTQSGCAITVNIYSTTECADPSPSFFHVIRAALETSTFLLTKSYRFCEKDIYSLLDIVVRILDPLKVGLSPLLVPPLPLPLPSQQQQQVFLEPLARLVTQVAVSVLLGSVLHVGDTFLVSKEQHNNCSSSSSSEKGGGTMKTTPKDNDQRSSGNDYSVESRFCEKFLLLSKLAQSIADTAAYMGINTDLLAVTTSDILSQLLVLCSPPSNSIDSTSGSFSSTAELIGQQVKVNIDNVSLSSSAADVRVRGSPQILWSLSSSKSRNEFSCFFSQLLAALARAQPSFSNKGSDPCGSIVSRMIDFGLQSYAKKSVVVAAPSSVPVVRKIRFVIRKEDDSHSTVVSTLTSMASTHSCPTKILHGFQINAVFLLSTQLRSLIGCHDSETSVTNITESCQRDPVPSVSLHYRVWLYSNHEQVDLLLQLLQDVSSSVDDSVRVTASNEIAWIVGSIIADRVTTNTQPSFISSVLDSLARYVVTFLRNSSVWVWVGVLQILLYSKCMSC